MKSEFGSLALQAPFSPKSISRELEVLPGERFPSSLV